MAHPTWFDFVKPRLSDQTMSQATLEYFKEYYPEVHAEAKLIASEAIARAGRIVPPTESEIPDDIPIGVQLVSALIERQVLGN